MADASSISGPKPAPDEGHRSLPLLDRHARRDGKEHHQAAPARAPRRVPHALVLPADRTRRGPLDLELEQRDLEYLIQELSAWNEYSESQRPAVAGCGALQLPRAQTWAI